MPQKNSKILIFDAHVDTVERHPNEMMGVASVPLELLRANISALLKQCNELFDDAGKLLGKAQLAHVDLSVGVAVDGSVGLFGTKVGTKGNGGMTIRLQFPDSK